MTVRGMLAGVLLLLIACTTTERRSPTTTTPGQTPALDVTRLSAEGSGAGTCGDFDVTWTSPELSGGEPATMSVSEEGQEIFSATGTDEFEQIQALWCGDVAADGSTALGWQRYTGGAHCCATALVEVLDDQRELLNVELGNAGAPEPKQLNDDAPLELQTTNDALAYFGDLPYAASPMLPQVFALRDGVYADATKEFRNVIEESLRNAEGDLDAAMSDGDGMSIRGAALAVFGHHVLLGDEDVEEIANALPAEDAQWLRDNAAQAVSLIRDADAGDSSG